jgi:hypothetical protein
MHGFLASHLELIILMKQSWQGIVQDQLHQGMQRRWDIVFALLYT